jgi:uncharacterized protein YegP (UPF0339 family)
MKFEFWKARNQRWYFHRRARNGKVDHPSQGYANSSNCRRAIRRAFGPDVKIVRVTPTEARR